MQTSTPGPHPTNTRAMADEADIGSGEKTAGQLETERMIKEVPPLPAGAKDAAKGDTADKEDKASDHKRVAEASEHDKAAHGQLQGEQNASRQDADPGMTPDAPV